MKWYVRSLLKKVDLIRLSADQVQRANLTMDEDKRVLSKGLALNVISSVLGQTGQITMVIKDNKTHCDH